MSSTICTESKPPWVTTRLPMAAARRIERAHVPDRARTWIPRQHPRPRGVDTFTRLARFLTRLDGWLCDVVLPARVGLGSTEASGRDARLWLVTFALPALVIGTSFLRLEVERLRRLAVASAIAMVLAALVIPLSPPLRDFSIRTSALSWIPGGEEIVRIDTLSAALLPFAAGLWLLTVAVTPRAALDREGLRRTALATLITLASFLTESALVLLILSAASVWSFLSALADPAHQYQRRVVAAYLGVSTLLFAIGVALLISPGAQNTRVETAAMWLIVIAALVRKGIVPFHAWVPEVFDHGRLGPAILFNAAAGAYDCGSSCRVPRPMLRIIALPGAGTVQRSRWFRAAPVGHAATSS